MTEVAIQLPAVPDLERQLEEHRVSLTGFCYRMLGSAFDAEDAVQETMVRAWRALETFEGRAALRSWLFGIATNVCIDMLNAGRRRALPMDVGPSSSGDAGRGPASELLWLTPIADDRVLVEGTDPADAAIARDGIRLAFVAALQHLNPRQRAVLILRDVLRWRAAEVAELLDCTTVSVHGLLRRARAVLADAGPVGRGRVEMVPDDEARELVGRYVDAFERYDVDALVGLLHDEVVLSMPPSSLWMAGVDAVRAWFIAATPDCRAMRFVPILANGSPAMATYRPTGPNGSFEPFAIQVVEVSAGGIIGIHAFIDPTLFPLFDAPDGLAA